MAMRFPDALLNRGLLVVEGIYQRYSVKRMNRSWEEVYGAVVMTSSSTTFLR